LRRAAPETATTSPRLGLTLLGLFSLGSAGQCGLLARSEGLICGAGQVTHCGWCFAAVGYLVLALGLLALAQRRPAASPIR